MKMKILVTILLVMSISYASTIKNPVEDFRDPTKLKDAFKDAKMKKLPFADFGRKTKYTYLNQINSYSHADLNDNAKHKSKDLYVNSFDDLLKKDGYHFFKLDFKSLTEGKEQEEVYSYIVTSKKFLHRDFKDFAWNNEQPKSGSIGDIQKELEANKKVDLAKKEIQLEFVNNVGAGVERNIHKLTTSGLVHEMWESNSMITFSTYVENGNITFGIPVKAPYPVNINIVYELEDGTTFLLKDLGSIPHSSSPLILKKDAFKKGNFDAWSDKDTSSAAAKVAFQFFDEKKDIQDKAGCKQTGGKLDFKSNGEFETPLEGAIRELFKEEGFKREDFKFLGESGKYEYEIENAKYFLVGSFSVSGSTHKGLSATYTNPQYFAKLTSSGAQRLFGTMKPYQYMMFVTPEDDKFNMFVLVDRNASGVGEPTFQNPLWNTYEHEFYAALERMAFEYSIESKPVKKDKENEIPDHVTDYAKNKMTFTITYDKTEIAKGLVNGQEAVGHCKGKESYVVSIVFPASKKKIVCEYYGEKITTKDKEQTLTVTKTHEDFVRLPFLPKGKDVITCTNSTFSVK
jgi:hypothetical protein